MSTEVIFWIIFIVFSSIVLVLGMRTKRYKENVAKAKPISPFITFGSAIVALPVAFTLYYLIVSIVGVRSLLSLGSFIGFVAFGLFYFFTWLLILNISAKLLRK